MHLHSSVCPDPAHSVTLTLSHFAQQLRAVTKHLVHMRLLMRRPRGRLLSEQPSRCPSLTWPGCAHCRLKSPALGFQMIALMVMKIYQREEGLVSQGNISGAFLTTMHRRPQLQRMRQYRWQNVGNNRTKRNYTRLLTQVQHVKPVPDIICCT